MDLFPSAVRNTCFAILSALETDLRYTLGAMSLDLGHLDLLPADVRVNAATRFAEDMRSVGITEPDSDLDLVPYTDFADLAKMMYGLSDGFVDRLSIDVRPLAARIESMAAARNRVCHSRPLHEEDLANFFDLLAFCLKDYGSLGWDQVMEFESKRLSDPSFVLRLEIPSFWRLGDQSVHHNIPLPDYDDTSFLGRATERKDVKKYLLGHHPVITIVGEGGVGKSALAMQCVYDLLDLGASCPFEAIVWVSLKTKVLTSRGIESIRDSVVDVLGVMRDVAQNLGSTVELDQDLADIMTEVLDYLSQLKVLLVIDNFETLTTNPFRQLLSDVPAGSKVLITSRVGLGELENRYPLATLDAKTANGLMRRYAKILSLALLSEASNARLEKYSELLFKNPLLIKWFVQSVAAGADPERLSSRGSQQYKAALQFCFENLFERLTLEQREVLHLLASARRQVTFTELMFLIQEISQTDQLRLEAAISTLHSSSMIKRTPPDSRSADVSTRINLTDVAAEYLAKFAPPSAAMLSKVQGAFKKLREATELSVVQTAIYKYELFTIRANTRDERICAVYLNQALQALRDNRLDEARGLVTKVTDLLPNYVEAYRVAAFVAVNSGDLFKASEELDNALLFDRHSAIVHYQYAQLLLQKLDDAQQALEQIDLALATDPGEEALETLRALALNRLGRCEEAAEIYEKQLSQLSTRPRKWRITTRDQAAECYRRWAEHDLKMKETGSFRNHIARAITILEDGIAQNDFDLRMGGLLVTVVEDALFFAVSSHDESYAKEVIRTLLDASQAVKLPRLKRFSRDHLPQAPSIDPEWNGLFERPAFSTLFNGTEQKVISVAATATCHTGQLKRLIDNKPFGFVGFENASLFFHKTAMANGGDWARLEEGIWLSFEVRMGNAGKPEAFNVRVI